MFEAIKIFLWNFLIFHVNGVYTILYFIKHNFFFLFGLVGIGLFVWEELRQDNYKYINDERRMI